MKTYDIAAYLTDEQKQRALSKEYVSPESDGPESDGLSARTAVGECPLGVALDLGCPLGIQVADALHPYHSDEWYAVRTAAWEFINDFDAGHIAPEDLAAALGATAPVAVGGD